MKNRKLLLIVSLVLAMTMSLGGTLAYLQDQDADVNVMTLGSVTIEQIEKERKEQSDDNLAYTNLQDYTQDKPLVPAVGPVKWAEGYQNWPTGGYNQLFTDELKNVQDKFVFVENTGKSDAYVRTIFAFEAGSLSFTEWNEMMHLNVNDTHWDWTEEHKDYSATINGNKYWIMIATYKGTEAVHDDGILPDGETTRPSLLQVFLDSEATNDTTAALDGNGNETYDILVLSQAIQADGFKDAADAFKTSFNNGEDLTMAMIEDWFEGEEEVNKLPKIVTNDEELAEEIQAGKTEIKLAAGTYNIPDEAQGKTLTLTGSEGVVLKLLNEGEDGCDYSFGAAGSGLGDVTFNNVTIDTTGNTGNYKGYAYMKGTYNNCNFVGAFSLNNANDYVFNNCTFDFENGYFWTWAANNVTFNECTFNGNSKNILAHGWASTQIAINNCDFAATEKGYTGSGDNTAAVEIDPAGTNTYTISFTGENTINENYAGWTRIKDNSTGHVITGLN